MGLAGLFTVSASDRDRWRTIAALGLALLPYLVVPVFIYAGFIGDAILAVKLPVSMFTGLGMALLISRLQDRRPVVGYLALGLTIAVFRIERRLILTKPFRAGC